MMQNQWKIIPVEIIRITVVVKILWKEKTVNFEMRTKYTIYC